MYADKILHKANSHNVRRYKRRLWRPWMMVGVGAALVGGLLWYASAGATTPPTVDSVTVAATSGGSQSSLTLAEQTTTTVYVHGEITDVDGCEDVATNGTVEAVFYRTNHASGSACSADNNDCYRIGNASCTKTSCDGGGDNTFSYECSAPIQYYADSTSSGTHAATTWTAEVTATDALSTTDTGSDTIEMATTIALGSTASISYGSLALDQESSQQNVVVTNTGNSGIDLTVQANGDMNCQAPFDAIPVENVHYSLTDGFSYVSGTALGTSAAGVELDLAPRTNDATPSTDSLYWLLKTPVQNAGGVCSHTMTLTATADTENGW